MNFGYQPASKIAEIDMIPKLRYVKMAQHMSQNGRYALNMMKGTCSAQVSIDYTSESDFYKKISISQLFKRAVCVYDG
jgi:glutamate--cysteine ligase